MSDLWQADPKDARWYGEVIGSGPGEDVSYVFAYSADDDEPDIDVLVPAGWVVEHAVVLPTPGNPAWVPGTDDD